MRPLTKSKNKLARWSFEAIGTEWVIDLEIPTIVRAEHVATWLAKLKERVLACVEDFDATYSRFREDSLVAAISKQVGTYPLPANAKTLLDFYQQMYRHTNGAVTPLIGSVLSEAGYDAQYSLSPTPLHVPPSWSKAIQYTHHPLELTATQPVLLDFGAAGKGYLVDIVSKLLDSEAILNYCVDASGDMRHHTTQAQPLRAGLEHPSHPAQVIGVAEFSNASLCGSAGNRRQWASFTHIIDPYTLTSPRRIAATWVVADSTLVADGMATCLFFAEPSTLQQTFAFEYVILYADGSAITSPEFPGGLFA